MAEPQHVPVMAARVGALLRPALSDRPAVMVDATLGLGGHAEAVLDEHPEVRLVGLDRDPEALDLARGRLSRFGERVTLVHAVFDALPAVLDDLGISAADGVLFDLGVSSMQLDRDERGFAYSRDTPLDMRMDRSAGRTAADIVNEYDAAALARVFRRYGEERFAARIADRIVAIRGRHRLETTGELADLVRDAIPAATRRSGGHPAKRVFQALRIEVNDELAVLESGLAGAIDRLAVGGRMVALAYHSLEDRAVKRAFAARSSDTRPADLPLPANETQPELELLTRGAEKASPREQQDNPRSRSVRLRAARRIRAAA